MSEKIHDLGNGFWNIRGVFRIGGIINIGTQCSLIQLDEKRFIFLDSYTLSGDIREQVMAMTHNGDWVEAVLNTHPFHTVHCEQMAKDFPQAIFYGSSRHQQKIPSVNWASDTVESEAVADRYPELRFSVPDGIYYISPNENIHAGSLLVHHPASQSLHVDDTFSTIPHYRKLQGIWQSAPKLIINPIAKLALKPEADSGKQFCDWADRLAHDWQDTRYLCAAHSEMVEFEKGEFEVTLAKAANRMRKLMG